MFTKYNKGAAIGHGVGLLLILAAGFGLQAKMNLGFPTWLIVKMVIWVVFGACLVLAKRKVLKGAIAWIIVIALAVLAGYIGRMKGGAFGGALAQNEAQELRVG